ncbi:hypothetical protein CBR_g18846 [Chara braunii]|uniref:Uncharacterized protein n=1 Tax=Chara braunii TaxID=69332 RepID=A0A388KWK1_CHABU|nr:hypothetical protein CBR_g18846 [Chara braunii]|eukprot:GBG74434.1 hypothetical protein CBR_g18846 [Chara braunii]
MEWNSDLLQFTMQLVKSEVNSGADNCEFMVWKATRDRVWSNKTDMWFKLNERKRNKIYDFLFLQTQPRKNTYAEYVRDKDHMLALLDNHHFASRMNAKTFLERLQSLYFVKSKKELKFSSYASLICTDDESTTGVEFGANAKEEESDTESLDLQYDAPLAEHARGSSSVGPSTSPTPLVLLMAKPTSGATLMKLLERLKALAVPQRALRPGSNVSPDHPSWKDDNIHFLLEPQSHSPEVDWGHGMIWHPRVIQPATQKGEWIMAVVVPGAGWVSIPGESKSTFLHLARISVLQKVRVENDTFAPDDLSVVSTVGRLFDELQDKCWLELTEDCYEVDTSPSKGMVDWKVPPPSGAHGSSGGGAPGGGGTGLVVRGVAKESHLVGRAGLTMAPRHREAAVGWRVLPSIDIRLLAPGRSMRRSPSTSRLHPPAQRGRRWQPWLLSDPTIGSGAVRDGNVSPERGRRPLGLEREATRAASGDTETTKSAKIRTSLGGGVRPGIVVPPGGAACTQTEGAELHEREGGEEMEEGKEGEEGEEEGEAGDEGEEGGETKLIEFLEGREGAEGDVGIGDDEGEDSEDDAGSVKSSDKFGQLYGEHREDNVDDDATTMEMETQVVSKFCRA